MNVYYAKTVLYAYPHISAIMEQIDELVERKALCSMSDYSPCVEIAEKILNLTKQKDTYIELTLFAEKALKKFTESEMDLFDYKYFKQKPKEYFSNIDTEGRGYFRKQIQLAKKFAKRLECAGVTDVWFEENCLAMDFFKEMLKRVIEHEVKSQKNKSKTQREKIKESKVKKDKQNVELSA